MFPLRLIVRSGLIGPGAIKNNMKLLIAGSRGINVTPNQIRRYISDMGWDVSELISGGANGVDKCGESWAKEHNIPIKQVIPDWSIGRQAGILRNKEMVNMADAALIFWDGKSRGTKSTLDFVNRSGIAFVLVRTDE